MAEEDDLLTELLTKHYEPATAGDTSASYLSTSDLYVTLNEHAPGRFSQAAVHDALRSIGYESTLIGDTIRWHVARRVIRS